MPRQIPAPVLTAAAGMLSPFFPDLTATRLLSALEGTSAPAQPTPLPEGLTKAQVCAATKLSLASVNRRLRDGSLPYTKLGPRLVRIPRTAVERLLTGTPGADQADAE